MTGLIAAAWKRYRAMAVPDNAGENQLTQTEQAFYAGASMVFTILVRGAAIDAGRPEGKKGDALRRMHALQAEIEEYGRAFDAKDEGEPS